MTGKMGPIDGTKARPTMLASSLRKREAICSSRSRAESSRAIRKTRSLTAWASVGLMPVEKTKLRARFQSHVRRVFEPATKAP